MTEILLLFLKAPSYLLDLSGQQINMGLHFKIIRYYQQLLNASRDSDIGLKTYVHNVQVYLTNHYIISSNPNSLEPIIISKYTMLVIKTMTLDLLFRWNRKQFFVVVRNHIYFDFFWYRKTHIHTCKIGWCTQ